VAEARQRLVSAHHIGSTHVNAEPTSQRQVVYHATPLAHPPPAQQSSLSAAASTEDLTRSFLRKDVDAVSPGTMRAALERFRSLEALSTASNTTSWRRGSSRRTASWRILPTSSKHVSDDASQGDTRPAGTVSDDTASKYKGDGVQRRSTYDIRRLDTTKDASKISDDGLPQHRSTYATVRLDTREDTTNHRTCKLASLSRFTQALAKFRSMEEMAQTVGVEQGGVTVSMKPGPAGDGGGLWLSTPLDKRQSPVEAPSPINSCRHQITRHLAASSHHPRRALPLNHVPSTSPERDESQESTLQNYQSLGSVFTHMPGLVRSPAGRRLPRWPPQTVSVPSSASRRVYLVSNIATIDNNDDLLPTPTSCCRTVARHRSPTMGRR